MQLSNSGVVKLFFIEKKIHTIFILLLIYIFMAFPAYSQASELTLKSFVLNTILQNCSTGISEWWGFGGKNTVNLNNKSDKLVVNSFSFRNIVRTNDLISNQKINAAQADLDPYEDEEPAVIGPMLCYPNPFRQSEAGIIGYRLSKPMDVEIRIYNMLAHMIFKAEFGAGANGGKVGYNRVQLDLETFNNYELSAGAYFYLLLYEGEVLAKGKMAVIP